ncbi:MAG: tetratricopeptide repeat protein [Bacteroidetes bacterium]|nr:tetratricopeptide repeat protein [Bacteroidota bacterium]
MQKISLKKAGITACFFLLTVFQTQATDNLWQFSAEMNQAYWLVLNLQPDKALEILNKISNPAERLHKIYVQSLSETVDVLITEDSKKFEQLEVHFKERLQQIESLPDSPEKLFLQAELNLQRGFNLLNLNQNIGAVLAIRRAYNETQSCLKKYPTFIPIKKTNGTLQVMLGSVPDKYYWFINLLGMRGSVTTGQKQLQELSLSKSSLSIEATILYFTVKGFINQQFPEAAEGLLECLSRQPDNRLLLFLTINMLTKDARSEKSLELISTLDKNNQGLQMHYVEYLRGEALINKGEYTAAISAYQKFIAGYRSQSFKKDAHYKIALAYWLLGNESQARIYFEKAKTIGREQSDPDKYAASQLAENKFPNPKLLKVRLFTDGGFYKEAQAASLDINYTELKTLKDQTEYFYRKARLEHKLNEVSLARANYLETIKLSADNPWYFAPNSALQLGYMYREQNDLAHAKKYFEMALGYKKHEYKNSIDSKARAALDQLKNP